MDDRERGVREHICEIGRRVWTKGWVAANDGNISARLDDGLIVATPTCVSKGFMTPEMLVVADMDGAVVRGDRKPSSEINMHLEAYRRRPDVGGIVHVHPPVATGYAVAHIPLDFNTLPEIVITLGGIPLARYGTPSTGEVAASIAELVTRHDAILLANHGAVTVGGDVMQAYYKMESLEHFAHISLVAHQLGCMKPLNEEQVRTLEGLRSKYGVKLGGEEG